MLYNWRVGAKSDNFHFVHCILILQRFLSVLQHMKIIPIVYLLLESGVKWPYTLFMITQVVINHWSCRRTNSAFLTPFLQSDIRATGAWGMDFVSSSPFFLLLPFFKNFHNHFFFKIFIIIRFSNDYENFEKGMIMKILKKGG